MLLARAGKFWARGPSFFHRPISKNDLVENEISSRSTVRRPVLGTDPASWPALVVRAQGEGVKASTDMSLVVLILPDAE